MIVDPKEVATLIETIIQVLEKHQKAIQILADKEALEIMIKEVTRKIVLEMDQEGFFDHTHNKETGEME